MYAVLQFVEGDGGGLAVVMNKWLTPRKQEVHWPPLKDKILENGNASPERNCKLYKIERIFYETDATDSFAIETSDENDSIAIERIAQEFSIPIRIRTSINPTATGFQEKVISLLSTIKVQNEQIVGLLKEKQISAKLSSDFKFPITHLEAVDDVEAKLQECQKFDNLVNYLKTLGGREPQTKITRILKYLLSDAANFNFYGKRSQKKAFNSLLLCKCVIEAVKGTSNSTEEDIEGFMKTIGCGV